MWVIPGQVNIADLNADTLSVGGASVVTNRGRVWFVHGNNGSDARNGKSWAKAFLTMDKAFDSVAGGDTIVFAGNISEHLTTPTGVQNVTVIGAGTRPRHADTHPLNGEDSSSTWKSGGTNSPLCTVVCSGWSFQNILFAAHASNYALEFQRNAVEDATEIDASHASVEGCRFASGAGGINDTGGTFNVSVKGNVFGALTTACILGVGNVGVGQLQWHIRDNHFNNFTNGVKIAAHECVIRDNYFTDGGTPNTTFVLNTNNGGGRDNFVVDNYFQTTSAQFNTPDVVGCATDVWRNTSFDGQANMIGLELGQPA